MSGAVACVREDRRAVLSLLRFLSRQSFKLALFCFNSFILADSEKDSETSVSLSSPWAANSELCLAAGCGAEDWAAELALDWSLGVGENRANVVARVASNIEEVAVWSLDEFLKFVHVFFRDWVRVQKVHFHFVEKVLRKY